jgi:hypothetical protein
VNKNRLQQLLMLFSLAFVLILPTVIVGYQNFGDIRNRAFGKQFLQEEGLFTVSTESTSNISVNSPFTTTINITSPSNIQLNYAAFLVEYDTKKVTVNSVEVDDTTAFKILKADNNFIIVPNDVVSPTTPDDLSPTKCQPAKACSFETLKKQKITLKINGVLVTSLTEQQRPIRVSLWGASEASTGYFWNTKILLPELKLGEYVKNTAPTFTSQPQNYISENTPFSYAITTTDVEKDTVTYSLTCPENVFCPTKNANPEGLSISGSTLIWQNPVAANDPYIITIYADDGKSISTQTFALRVLKSGENNFSCSFTPGFAVKVIDISQITPLIMQLENSAGIKKVDVFFKKDNVTEASISYNLTNTPQKIILDENSTPPLQYKFNEGTYKVDAVITDGEDKLYSCELDNPYAFLTPRNEVVVRNSNDLLGYLFKKVSAATTIVAGANQAPQFTTNPYTQSTPGASFIEKNTYNYVLTATDPDGDPLSYTKVTAPAWANISVITNSGGTLSLQITGVPQTGGSNLFSFSVNDGAGHYITQTWIINVDYANNDIPKITLKQPTKALNLYQGTPLTLSWDVQDRNQVVRFDLYHTRTLGGSRTALQTNIDYRTRSMLVSTRNLSPGDYYFVLTATDSFSPPATGEAVTYLVRILPAPVTTTPPVTTVAPTPTQTTQPTTTITTTTSPTATDTPTVTPTVTETTTPTSTGEEPTPTPEIVNITLTNPKEGEEISADKFKIVGRITASKDAKIQTKNVKVFVNDLDVTAQVDFSADDTESVSMVYTPRTLLDIGSQTVTVRVEDTKGVKGEKRIGFKITSLTITNPDEDVTNIFGFTIPSAIRNVAFIGIAILVIALLLPIFMYMTWRRSRGPITAKPAAPLTPPPLQPKPIAPTFTPQGQNLPRMTSTPTMQQTPSQQMQPTQTPPIAPRPQPSFTPENAGLTQSNAPKTMVSPKPPMQQTQIPQQPMPVQQKPAVAPQSSSIPQSSTLPRSPSLTQTKPAAQAPQILTPPVQQKPQQLQQAPVQSKSLTPSPQETQVNGPATLPQKLSQKDKVPSFTPLSPQQKTATLTNQLQDSLATKPPVTQNLNLPPKSPVTIPQTENKNN